MLIMRTRNHECVFILLLFFLLLQNILNILSFKCVCLIWVVLMKVLRY